MGYSDPVCASANYNHDDDDNEGEGWGESQTLVDCPDQLICILDTNTIRKEIAQGNLTNANGKDIAQENLTEIWNSVTKPAAASAKQQRSCQGSQSLCEFV